ncbi:hypothetical protein BH23BAC3_BH23BAC3_11210 [soil metagenome]
MNVIDTSVVLKLLFREPDSEIAVHLLEIEREFYAPEYLRIEFLSNVTKKIRTGVISLEEGRKRMSNFNQFNFHYDRFENIEHLAFELSAQYPITFFDSLFVSVAFEHDVKLYTFDKRLKRSVNGTDLAGYVVVPE